ncbi:MAG: hypothetical protein HY657_01105 [Acidobacteria bacterium]|nr:hypothetical protein [Acidobacteriota bacterium]
MRRGRARGAVVAAAVLAPGHASPHDREQPADRAIGEVLGQATLQHAARRHLPRPRLERAEFAIEIRPRLAHFRADDSRFAIHAEFSFNAAESSLRRLAVQVASWGCSKNPRGAISMPEEGGWSE